MLKGLIAVDLETHDEGISGNMGPGWPWRGGEVCGIAICAENWKGYLPIAHLAGGNMDKTKVIQLVRRWLSDPQQPKVGANFLYDLGWLSTIGIEVKGPCYDVQWAEALLDEHLTSYSLESLSHRYLGYGKDEKLLREAAQAWAIDPKADLWKLPASYVGPYAEADASQTRAIFLKQKPRLEAEDLWALFELECCLIPLYLAMRKRGVRVDLDKANALNKLWDKEKVDMLAHIKDKTGFVVVPTESDSIVKAMRAVGITNFDLTEKTRKPSITADWLENQDHWLPKMILEIRQIDKLQGTFIQGHLLGHSKGGRIYTEFHPLRSEDIYGAGVGTVSGRLSSSHPNLQQIPARSERGMKIRSCFLPEKGEQWVSFDFNQQEPRLTIHYASLISPELPGIKEAVNAYRSDETLNFHKLVAQETGLPYATAKALNLALTYGRGVASTARELKISTDEAQAFINRYHARVPFVRGLSSEVQKSVKQRGELVTLDGRKCRFPYWEPILEYGSYSDELPLPKDQAQKRWPGKRLRRAWLHKALNRLIQGSAAGQTKIVMKHLLESGYAKYILLQVHDELCASIDAHNEAIEKIRKIMEEAVTLTIPSKCTVTIGKTWGDLKK